MSQFTKLLERVEKGDEIILTRDGKPVARLSPCTRPAKRRVPGSAKGKIFFAEDFNAPLPEDVLRDFQHFTENC